MKIKRTENATRSMIYGIFLKIYQIVVPFAMRTAIIYYLGVQYLGLNSLFTSVLQVLNLAELGVGSAMVFSMYKPIADDDEKMICALIHLYKVYYRVIGLIIAVIGLLLIPFIPKLITGSVPENINIYVLYLLNLTATVLTYWMFAYRNSLFQAHQRTDITSKVSLFTDTFKYILQLISLALVKNYYLFVIATLVSQILHNIITALLSMHIYPKYRPEGKLPKEEKKQINRRIMDLFTGKFGGTITSSADTIVISAFLGLTTLAVYENYYYIMYSVSSMIMIIFSSCSAGIGNSLVTESDEKNYNDFKKLVFMTLWLVTVCINCFVCLYQPFMKLWVGKAYILDMSYVILFAVYFFVYIMQQLSCVYKDAAGIWHQDRFRPLITGIVNLSLNIIMVRIWGLYAILLSTIISFVLVAMPWVIHNLFTLVFRRSPKEYVFMMFRGVIIVCASSFFSYLVCSFVSLDNFVGIIMKGIIAVIISNICLIVVYHRSALYKQMLDTIDRMTKNKFIRFTNLLR